ncbi:MAG: prepilin-type N-terminal cleavage/methylation domain-containing protein [Verrucomicrobia bacterium]|nr:prepilin-type N-terminal cleavage/methylation domain-containing protein [Verrucomicrobiota bacterium]
MNPKRTLPLRKGFTLVELLVVVAIIAIVWAMILPMRNRGDRLPAGQGRCMNNLKQIGLGLIMYSEDNNNHFPWEVSTNAGGNAELNEAFTPVNIFLGLTNNLRQPHLFACPTDKARAAATNFDNFSNTNLSYFVSLSAVATGDLNTSRMILAGDRHLSVSNQPVKPGLCLVDSNSTPGWTRELHESKNLLQRGNLLFADGHVVFIRSSDLPASFRNQSITASRLVIP